MRLAAVAILVGIPVVVGSGCRSSSEFRRTVLKDRAEICLVDPAVGLVDAGAPGAGATLPRDKAMQVIVRSPCLAKCTRDQKVTCSVKRELDKLTVTTEVSWSTPWDLDECRGACDVVEAKCNAEAVPGAALTFVYGGETASFETPARIESACFTGAPKPWKNKLLPVAAPPPDAGPPKPPDPEVLAAAAPPSTGAPPTPKITDQICALPFPATGKGNKAPIGISIARPNPCEGQSCKVPPKTPKCTLKRQGASIEVKTDLPLATGKPRQPCTDDCPKMVASCKTEALPPGQYTVTLGTEASLTVQLPLAKETCTP